MIQKLNDRVTINYKAELASAVVEGSAGDNLTFC